MSATARDWFRRQSWSEGDRADFQRRLSRVRSSRNKAQYLRVQAVCLKDAGTQNLLHPALELLDQLLKDVPERTELAIAHMLRAECLVRLHRNDEAVDAYRAALAAQRAFPTVGTDADLGLGELALALGRTDLYTETLEALEEFGAHKPFPVQQYRAAAISACISESRGDLEAARRFAEKALAAAAQKESPFRHHRELGLAGALESGLEARLRRLVGGKP